MNKILKRKTLFLDRDGIINIDKGYVYTPERCVFLDGIVELLKKAKEKKYLIIVITNQSGIGRGYYSEQDFHFFMKWINKNLGGMIDDYYFCPFHSKYGLGKYKKKSNFRKPNPGMINKAIRDYNIDPKSSIFIGDKNTDMLAAFRASIRFRLLLGHLEEVSEDIGYKVIEKLSEAQKYLI